MRRRWLLLQVTALLVAALVTFGIACGEEEEPGAGTTPAGATPATVGMLEEEMPTATAETPTVTPGATPTVVSTPTETITQE